MFTYSSISELIAEAKRNTLLLKGKSVSLKNRMPAYEGISFEDYQEYSYNEPAKHIAWNVFAKTNKLYVKTFEREENASISILCDNYLGLQYQSQYQSKFNLRNSLLTLLLVSYIKLGKRVNVYFMGKNRKIHTFMVRTENDVYKVLKFVFQMPLNSARFNKRVNDFWYKNEINASQSLVWLTDLSNLDDFYVNLLKFQRKYVFRIIDKAEESFLRNEMVSNGLISFPLWRLLGGRYKKKYRDFMSKKMKLLRLSHFSVIPFYTHIPTSTSYMRFIQYGDI